MSDNKKEVKRKNKTKEELTKELENQNLTKFKEALQALETKYGYKLEPAMYYSKMGAFPQIEVQKIPDSQPEPPKTK